MRRSMGNRLGDRFPLGSNWVWTGAGRVFRFFFPTVGFGFFLINKKSNNREGSGFFTS